MVTKPRAHKVPPPFSHHSLADWDIDNTYWAITTLQYVSPPSCLFYANIPVVAFGCHLCKNAATLYIPFGRISTYSRVTIANREFSFLFRNTAPVGSANQNNCYKANVNYGATTWRLSEMVDGVENRYWTTTKQALAINVWHHHRLSWWLSNWQLIVTYEVEVEGVWVQQGDVITIPNPLFGGESTQRVGVRMRALFSADRHYIDDTKIWEYA